MPSLGFLSCSLLLVPHEVKNFLCHKALSTSGCLNPYPEAWSQTTVEPEWITPFFELLFFFEPNSLDTRSRSILYLDEFPQVPIATAQRVDHCQDIENSFPKHPYHPMQELSSLTDHRQTLTYFLPQWLSYVCRSIRNKLSYIIWILASDSRQSVIVMASSCTLQYLPPWMLLPSGIYE